ncbi:MAG: Ig-like domain-containing protein [Allosphingosinicella sp.]
MRVTAKTIAILLGSAGLALLPSNAAGQFNNPPTVGNNSFSVRICQEKVIDLTSNDSDPEGNYPLTVTSVGTTALGSFYISSASSVTFYAADRTGGDTVPYTVEDSLGASASGQISIGVFARPNEQCA